MFRTALLALAFLTACDSEIDDKPSAEVGPAAAPAAPAAPAPAAPAAAAVPAGALALGAGSHIDFVGAKVTKDHPGGFKVLSGHASTADGQLTGGKVEIDLSSVFTDSEKLTRHLMDPDFFDVGVYPTASFEISGVEAGAEGGSSTVVGTLDLHGVRKEIRFPATVTVTDGRASVAAEFTLMRKDFGITYPGKAEDLIRDEVLVKGELVFGG